MLEICLVKLKLGSFENVINPTSTLRLKSANLEIEIYVFIIWLNPLGLDTHQYIIII